MREKIKSLSMRPKYKAMSSWWEHVPIGHWLIEKIQPEKVVELGTHYGVSFFCFCEAAEKYSPNTFICSRYVGGRVLGNMEKRYMKK